MSKYGRFMICYFKTKGYFMVCYFKDPFMICFSKKKDDKNELFMLIIFL